jgi:hypothetical protein
MLKLLAVTASRYFSSLWILPGEQSIGWFSKSRLLYGYSVPAQNGDYPSLPDLAEIFSIGVVFNLAKLDSTSITLWMLPYS